MLKKPIDNTPSNKVIKHDLTNPATAVATTEIQKKQSGNEEIVENENKVDSQDIMIGDRKSKYQAGMEVIGKGAENTKKCCWCCLKGIVTNKIPRIKDAPGFVLKDESRDALAEHRMFSRYYTPEVLKKTYKKEQSEEKKQFNDLMKYNKFINGKTVKTNSAKTIDHVEIESRQPAGDLQIPNSFEAIETHRSQKELSGKFFVNICIEKI